MAQTTACTRRVAVTGASGGIGAALLKAYAAPGTRIYACARNRDNLEANARTARLYGADVVCETFDVRDDASSSTGLIAWWATGILTFCSSIRVSRPLHRRPKRV